MKIPHTVHFVLNYPFLITTIKDHPVFLHFKMKPERSFEALKVVK
jgi:hypothetical protein